MRRVAPREMRSNLTCMLLPDRTARRLQPYLQGTPLELPELKERLQLGLQEFLHASHESEFADRALGKKLYAAFEQLLERSLEPEGWPATRAAALYLIERHDEEDDLDSPLGFEDDAEVFNDLCEALGYPELKVRS